MPRAPKISSKRVGRPSDLADAAARFEIENQDTDDFAEANRGDREVDVMQAQHGQANREGDQAGDDHAADQPTPSGSPTVCDQHARYAPIAMKPAFASENMPV